MTSTSAARLVFIGCAQAFMLAFGSALPQFSTLSGPARGD
jgi:hypothetical protein